MWVLGAASCACIEGNVWLVGLLGGHARRSSRVSYKPKMAMLLVRELCGFKVFCSYLDTGPKGALADLFGVFFVDFVMHEVDKVLSDQL